MTGRKPWFEALKEAAREGRRCYAPGTPEKYPNAKTSVTITDLEAALRYIEAASSQTRSGE